MSDSLRPHESQCTRPPCPSPTPGVHSDSRPSSQWCHPAISSSVVPFTSCPQSLPASESFPMSQLFAWGGQSTGVSALASFLPKKSLGWSSEWTGWISLQSKGLSRVTFMHWEDPLATHSSILSCRIPWTEEPGRLWSIRLQRVGHDWATKTFTTFTYFQGSLGKIGVSEHKQIFSWSGKLLNLFCEGKICLA